MMTALADLKKKPKQNISSLKEEHNVTVKGFSLQLTSFGKSLVTEQQCPKCCPLHQ